MWNGASSQPAMGTGLSPWAITKQDVLRYTQVFNGLAVNGRLGGKEARPALLQYGLPKAELKVVWDLSDVDRDGSLTLPEFAIAVHVISLRIKGFPLPQALPPELVSSIKMGGVDSSHPQPQQQTMAPPMPQVQPPGIANAMSMQGGLMAAAAPNAPGMLPPAPAAAPAEDDDWGEFGDFESATFDDGSAPAADSDVFGAASQPMEWPVTAAPPAQAAAPPVQLTPGDGLDLMFGSAPAQPAAGEAASGLGMSSGGGEPAAQAPLTAADRAARMLDVFQSSVHDEQKPRPTMADLMRSSPKHSQSMTSPSSQPTMGMPPASPFGNSTSRVYDVFTALVEEDLGIKASSEPDKCDGAGTEPGAISAAPQTMSAGGSASDAWGGGGFGGSDEDFGDFADGTGAGDDDFAAFEDGPAVPGGADVWPGVATGSGGVGFAATGTGGGLGESGESGSVLKKGESVLYRRADGTKAEAVVVSVDHSLDPPSYVIRVDGRERETERSRLERPGEAASVKVDVLGMPLAGIVEMDLSMGGMGMDSAAAGSGSDVWAAAMGAGLGGDGAAPAAANGLASDSKAHGATGGEHASDDAWGGFGDAWGQSADEWGGEGTVSAGAPEPVGGAETYDDDDESVKQLMEMGFSRKRVVMALDECNYDIEKASDWLLEHIGEGDEVAIHSSVPPSMPDSFSFGEAAAAPTSLPAMPQGSDALTGGGGGGLDLMDLMLPAQPAPASAGLPAALDAFAGLMPALADMGDGSGQGADAVQAKAEEGDWGGWGDEGEQPSAGVEDVGGIAGSGVSGHMGGSVAASVGESGGTVGGAMVLGDGGAAERTAQKADSDDDFGDFEEYKGGAAAELPDVEALNVMTQESLQLAGVLPAAVDAGGADAWGGFGEGDAGWGDADGWAADGGVAPAAAEEAPKLVGLDEDPFADLIGSGAPPGEGEGEGEAAEEGEGLIFGNVDIAAVVSGPSLVAPAAVDAAATGEVEGDGKGLVGGDEWAGGGDEWAGQVAGGGEEDEFGEVDWGAAGAVEEASTGAPAAAMEDGGEWGADDDWGDTAGGWGEGAAAAGDGGAGGGPAIGGEGLVGLLGGGAAALNQGEASGQVGGAGAMAMASALGGEGGLGAMAPAAGWGADPLVSEASTGAGAGAGAASLLGDVDLLGGMSGWSTGPGESLVGDGLGSGEGGGRKVSLDLMDMTAEPAESSAAPLALGWGLGLGGGEEEGGEGEDGGGLGQVLECCTKELRRGRVVLKELEKLREQGELGGGGRLAGLLAREEMREYARQVACVLRVGLRVGAALRQEGLKRRALEDLLGLGREVGELVGRVDEGGEWAGIWTAETESGVGKLGAAEEEGFCRVCRCELECLAASEAVVDWGGYPCHSACINLCINCAPPDVLPALSLPSKTTANQANATVASALVD